jgi:hypothetical protein
VALIPNGLFETKAFFSMFQLQKKQSLGGRRGWVFLTAPAPPALAFGCRMSMRMKEADRFVALCCFSFFVVCKAI